MDTLTDTELYLLSEYASGILTNTLIEHTDGLSTMNCHVLLPVNYTNSHISIHKVRSVYLLPVAPLADAL